MNELVARLMENSLAGAWLIAAVLVIRCIFRNAPKRIFPLLWCTVILRLILPYTPQSSLSLMPVSGGTAESIADTPLKALPYGTIVWVVGVACMLLYGVISYGRIKRKLATAVKLTADVYQSDCIQTPFVLGFFSPRIYMPFGLEQAQTESVLAHERAHIKLRHHRIKPIAFVILSIYWFHPLVWVLYVCLGRDMELNCDELAVRNMNAYERSAYCDALLAFSSGAPDALSCKAAFGGGVVKKRIRNVLSCKKSKRWVTAAAVTAFAVIALCFATSPKQQNPSADFSAVQNEKDRIEAENAAIRQLITLQEQTMHQSREE